MEKFKHPSFRISLLESLPFLIPNISHLFMLVGHNYANLLLKKAKQCQFTH